MWYQCVLELQHGLCQCSDLSLDLRGGPEWLDRGQIQLRRLSLDQPCEFLRLIDVFGREPAPAHDTCLQVDETSVLIQADTNTKLRLAA